MPSIKPSTPLELAHSTVPWARDVERWVRSMELNSSDKIGQQQVNAALLVIDTLRPRIEALVNLKGEAPLLQLKGKSP